jgi:hypothetical protein
MLTSVYEPNNSTSVVRKLQYRNITMMATTLTKQPRLIDALSIFDALTARRSVAVDLPSRCAVRQHTPPGGLD